MTRDDLYDILRYVSHATDSLDLIWGQPFDGETEKITKKDEGEDHATTKLRLKMAHDAIRTAVDAFDAVNMWEGYCGSTDMIECLKDFLPTPIQPNTTKLASSTSPVTEREDHETAEQKVAWLTEILVVKAGDPIFDDYWLRLARRNLLLGLPLKTEEPDLNSTTEDYSAIDQTTSDAQDTPTHPNHNDSNNNDDRYETNNPQYKRERARYAGDGRNDGDYAGGQDQQNI